MTDLHPRSAPGDEAWTAIIAAPEQTLLALDFDGTLAPIVGDPEQAYADPDAVAALARLGERMQVVIITGRPVRSAVRLGRFTEHPGLRSMVVIGQYGVERWNAADDEYRVPPDPPAVQAAAQELPEVLADLGLADARVEHKGRAIGVHTRGLADPVGALQSLSRPLQDLAERHELVVEPGKNVLEVRSPGMDKGTALRSILAETGAKQVVYAGDDLGDLPAFEVVRALREDGVPGLLICSASTEEDALADISDVVVDGPAGVAAWLNALADAIEP